MKTHFFMMLILAGSLGTLLYDARAYTQPASVVDSGGGLSTSPGYENLGAIGQPVVGLSTGTGKASNHAGFIPVLGGNDVLWPVIGFDPATFTFTFYIGDSAPAGQGLNLTNAGGSTLEWTVSRTTAWLSLVPLNGTGAGSVTVGILTANLPGGGVTPGTYPDTISISATGAENSGVTIPVTLTVSQDYTLTVTFATPTIPEGGGTVAFNPAPPVGSATCTGKPCERNFHSETQVTLTAFGDSNSLFDTWSGACTGGSCSVTMDNNRNVTATFKYVPPIMIDGTQPQYFTSFLLAYNYAKANLLTNVVFKTRAFTFNENLYLSDPLNVTIKGGYALNFLDRPGYTLLQGKLTVGKGSLVSDRLTVK